jgi:outer membrane protein
MDALRVRNSEKKVRLDVLNAADSVESAKADVKLARVAAGFAKKRVEAEQRKYDLGTTVMFFVLQAQTQQAAAESELVRQAIQYRRSLLSLFRYTGELLDQRGVTIQ